MLRSIAHSFRYRLALRRAASHVRAGDENAAPAPMPFIVGAPRSGTTLLRMMLDSHPDLAMPPETGFVLEALRLRPGAGASEFHSLLTNHPKEAPAWRDFGISPELFRTQIGEIEKFSVPDGLRCFYRTYSGRFGKSRCGDKTPAYGPYLRAIERLLPEAHFIHIIRDGRDAALSLRGLWFAPSRNMRGLAKAWCRHVAATRSQGERCKRYLEVRYEDLIRDPQRALRAVCEFIALTYDPEMNNYAVRAPQRLREHYSRVTPDGSVLVTHAQRLLQQRLVMQPPDVSRIYGWKSAMDEHERAQFDGVARRLLSDLGYEVSR